MNILVRIGQLFSIYSYVCSVKAAGEQLDEVNFWKGVIEARGSNK